MKLTILIRIAIKNFFIIMNRIIYNALVPPNLHARLTDKVSILCIQIAKKRWPALVSVRNYNGWPPKHGTVDFSGFLLLSTVISFHLAGDRASFPHYNNTKIIKFG